MAVKLIWTPGAVRDLERIHAYVAADAPRYADVVAARIVDAFERLTEFPQSGRVYRLVYQLRGERAEILAIPRRFVRWRGTLTGPGAYGHMGGAFYELRVEQIREVRPAREADCR